MLRQDDLELNALSDLPFEEGACKEFLHFYFAEQICNFSYNAEEIINETLVFLNKGLIRCDLGVYGWDNSLKILQYLGVPAEKVRSEGPDYICEKDELEMLDLRRTVKGKEYQHFVAGDGEGHYSWDSLGIRPWQRDYKINSKRIITLKDNWYAQ